MARVAVGDLDLAVERFGDPARPAILLVPVEAATAGAALIPGARIAVVEGLGHTLSGTAAAAVIPPLLGFLGGLEATSA
jgi:hypothetical protein